MISVPCKQDFASRLTDKKHLCAIFCLSYLKPSNHIRKASVKQSLAPSLTKHTWKNLTKVFRITGTL